jgi:hypothetical protein
LPATTSSSNLASIMDEQPVDTSPMFYPSHHPSEPSGTCPSALWEQSFKLHGSPLPHHCFIIFSVVLETYQFGILLVALDMIFLSTLLLQNRRFIHAEGPDP